MICLGAALSLLYACKKELNTEKAAPFPPLSATASQQTIVAQTLSKALANEPALRKLLKDEALKQFDKDYDVLFQLIKDIKPDGKETVYEKLLQYSSSKAELVSALDALPLLTIYIPDLPWFNAEKWNTATEIPVVAVAPGKAPEGVAAYDASSARIDIPNNAIPGFPVLVVKDNERVVLNSSIQPQPGNSAAKTFSAFSDKEVPFNQTYSFISGSFDGISHNLSSRTGVNVPGSYEIDPVAVAAYKSGNEWHRDYVYYGIDASNNITSGKFRNDYSEFIKSFRFIKGNDYTLISDDGNDPKPLPGVKSETNRTLAFGKQPFWTEGNFEFRISVLINAKNGAGQELRKIFTVKGSDLFDIIPKEQSAIFGWKFYLIDHLEPKLVPLNIELIPWDLENYGSAWKFILAEYDPSIAITNTVTNSATYGGNFDFSIPLGDKIKVGPKFGVSATSTSSTTYQYKTTTGSDDLGEGILDFRSPIITSYTAGTPGNDANELIHTYEVSTGVVSFAVEPQRINESPNGPGISKTPGLNGRHRSLTK